jgi:hypothetical protein
MLLKRAVCEFKDVTPIEYDDAMIRTAASKIGLNANSTAREVVESEVRKHKTALFFKAKAIVADETNSNGDNFPEAEVIKSAQTFVGVPFYTNHQNQDIEKARGKIIYAEWNPEEKAVYVIGFVDREAYPQICRGIEQDYMTGVSMGASVEYSECSVCQNKATSPDSYCSHIKMMKGRKFSGTVKNVKTGEILHLKDKLVYEVNYGIRFIELSGVGDPACRSCHIKGVIDNGEILQKAAACQNDFWMYKENAITKVASQEEVNQLEQALASLEAISISLIKNRKQVEVEFASDLVKILSDLQQFTDELVGAGFAQMPGAAGAVPGGVPGTAMPGAETLPPLGGPLPATETMPISEEPFAPAAVTGMPGTPAVNRPRMPSAPVKPITGSATDKLSKIAAEIEILKSKIAEKDTEQGEGEDMKRRIPPVADRERSATKQILGASMQENTGTFGNDKSTNINGGSKMSGINSTAERRDASNVTTEKQLEGDTGSSKRTGEEQNSTTEKQLEAKRQGEPTVVTEKQLVDKQTGEVPSVTSEKQLEAKRTGQEANSVTQVQLADGYRKDSESTVVTEKQLEAKPGMWERASFARKDVLTAADHLASVVKALAKSAVESCATPSQIRNAVCGLVNNLKVKAETLDFITKGGVSISEDVGLVSRAKYWGGKGVTIASTTAADVKKSVLDNLNVLIASNEKVHPEVVTDVLEVVAEDARSEKEISAEIDAMLAVKPEEPNRIASSKDDIRKALAKEPVVASKQPMVPGTPVAGKKPAVPGSKEAELAKREEERQKALAAVKMPDRVIIASFAELGMTKEEVKADPKKAKQKILDLARASATAENRKLAAVTNVDISPDGTINIAIDTEGKQEEIEVPLEGETPESTAPEGDVTGEGLDNLMAPPPTEPAAPGLTTPGANVNIPSPEAPLPTAASKGKMTKEAQFGGGTGGGMPGAPMSGVGEPSAPGIGEKPAMEDAVQSFTETAEPEGEAPGVGEQMMPGAICPSCHSTDTTTGKKGMEAGAYECNACGLRYQVQVVFEVLNPENMVVEKDEEKGKVKEPELPSMPVAAYIKLDKDSMQKIASSSKKYGNVCPACGMVECKASEQGEGTATFVCPSCQTKTEKEILVSKDDASEAYMRVAWTIEPKKVAKFDCQPCKAAAKKFAAKIRVAKMIKAASDNSADPKTAFPMANCIERVSRMYGANAVASYGECKGKVLSDCVCKELETFGLTKNSHLVRLAEVYSQEDPMDECLKVHQDKGFKKAQAETICNAFKKECSSEADSNELLMAFAGTNEFTKEELEAMNEYKKSKMSKGAQAEDMEGNIGDPIDVVPATPEVEETVTIELPAEVAKDIAGQVEEATEAPAEVVPGSPETGGLEVADGTPLLEEPAEAVELDIDATAGTIKSITVIKTAEAPKKVEDIEHDVKSGIPRGKATLGNESAANIDVAEKKPEIPRGTATMGQEQKFDAKLPDIPVDNDTIGGEKETQKGMPATNNEIKGTVIAEKAPALQKEAKTPKLVKDIEHDVEAKIPRKEELLGKEVKVPEKKLDVPRGDATLGDEEKFVEKLPDVPMDDAKMGGEKDTQKGMPAVNDEIKGTVIAEKRERQMEKLSAGRHKKACLVAAKLVAEGKIATGDMDEVVEVLSKLELDRMEAFAAKMFKAPARTVQAATLPVGITQEASAYAPEQPKSLVEQLSEALTIGSGKLNDSLVEDGKR